MCHLVFFSLPNSFAPTLPASMYLDTWLPLTWQTQSLRAPLPCSALMTEGCYRVRPLETRHSPGKRGGRVTPFRSLQQIVMSSTCRSELLVRAGFCLSLTTQSCCLGSPKSDFFLEMEMRCTSYH